MQLALDRPLDWRTVGIACAAAVLAVPNAMLLGEAFGFITGREYVFDWWQFSTAVERLGTGRLYDWGEPGQFGNFYDYRYSPLFVYVVAPFTWLGIGAWRILHVAVLAFLPWRVALFTLLLWPFWLDVAHANVMTFGFVAGLLALRGSRPATWAFVAIALLVPRPVLLPALVWLFWQRPADRLPMLGIGAVYAILTLATGEAFAFVASLSQGSDLMVLEYNWGPTAWFGPVWLLIGVPLGAWLTWKGRVGWAGLAMSPHVLPYYLLVLLWEVTPRRGTSRR